MVVQLLLFLSTDTDMYCMNELKADSGCWGMRVSKICSAVLIHGTFDVLLIVVINDIS